MNKDKHIVLGHREIYGCLTFFIPEIVWRMLGAEINWRTDVMSEQEAGLQQRLIGLQNISNQNTNLLNELKPKIRRDGEDIT